MKNSNTGGIKSWLSYFEEANEELYSMLPEEQKERVFSRELCDISPDFLGFIDIYKSLSMIIPKHWHVIDFGCAYAPQAFLFRSHSKYTGVDLLGIECRFSAKNTKHYKTTISEFIGRQMKSLKINQKQTFAICSYVPPWGGDNGKLVRESFENVFIYYPSLPSINWKRITR